MRITEPFVKVHYVLWLVGKGANKILVSVDGAEPNHEMVAQTLEREGYNRQPLIHSKVDWTGVFTKAEVTITVFSNPGIDIKAHFTNGELLLAECKGEPTASGIKSGQDLTALYAALGQFILTANDEAKNERLNLALVVPDSTRLKEKLALTGKNTRLKKLGIGLALVDESGKVKEITPNFSNKL